MEFVKTGDIVSLRKRRRWLTLLLYWSSVSDNVIQKQTAVTAHFKRSEQLLLFFSISYQWLLLFVRV